MLSACIFKIKSCSKKQSPIACRKYFFNSRYIFIQSTYFSFSFWNDSKYFSSYKYWKQISIALCIREQIDYWIHLIAMHKEWMKVEYAWKRKLNMRGRELSWQRLWCMPEWPRSPWARPSCEYIEAFRRHYGVICAVCHGETLIYMSQESTGPWNTSTFPEYPSAADLPRAFPVQSYPSEKPLLFSQGWLCELTRLYDARFWQESLISQHSPPKKEHIFFSQS